MPLAMPPPRSHRPGIEFGLAVLVGFALAGGVVWGLRAARSAPPTHEAAAVEQMPPGPIAAGAAAQARAAFERGYEHYRREEYAPAYREFYRATQLDPAAPEPLMGLAKVYEALDYDERAAEACRSAIAMDPAYHGARVALAKLLCDLGKNQESLAILQDSARTDPNDPLVWAEIAVNELRLGNPQRAIPLLERYNRARGPQEWGYVQLGRSRADAGDPEAGEHALRKALAINPRSQLGHLWLGPLLRALETQRKELEQAIAREPADGELLVSLLVRLAQVRQLQGNAAEAVTPLQRAVELAPEDPRLRELLAKLRQAGGSGAPSP